MAVSMIDRGTISDPISLPHFWLRRLHQNSFSQKFCGILYRGLREMLRRLLQEFHKNSTISWIFTQLRQNLHILGPCQVETYQF